MIWQRKVQILGWSHWLESVVGNSPLMRRGPRRDQLDNSYHDPHPGHSPTRFCICICICICTCICICICIHEAPVEISLTTLNCALAGYIQGIPNPPSSLHVKAKIITKYYFKSPARKVKEKILFLSMLLKTHFWILPVCLVDIWLDVGLLFFSAVQNTAKRQFIAGAEVGFQKQE